MKAIIITLLLVAIGYMVTEQGKVYQLEQYKGSRLEAWLNAGNNQK